MTDARPTRVGLIGVNERARRLLLPGLEASPRARVTAVCSRSLAKAGQAAAAVGADVLAFDDVAPMVRSGLVDAVFVNTPVETHFDLCMAALEVGCAVICEKPLATTTEQAVALAHAAATRGVRTAVNFTYRSVPGYRLTERLLGAAGIGTPLHGTFELLQGHNFFPGFPRASALLDSGVHLYDALLGLTARAGFGSLVDVCAAPMGDPPANGDGNRNGNEEGGPERAAEPDFGWGLTVRTASGGVVSALFSRRALGWRNGLRWSLYGDEGAIEAELDSDRTEVRVARRNDERPQGTWRRVGLPADIASDDARFPMYHMDRLVGAVRGEERFPGFADAVETHRLADAIAESAKSGCRTALS